MRHNLEEEASVYKDVALENSNHLLLIVKRLNINKGHNLGMEDITLEHLKKF